ncbi:UdgX family uracil-DNA binding protein [Novacetimonas cocois]|uniref:Type-4 uracil-DNA glycosylase n=1 Tax=Novacetimonas cocois TaxID=1747507 RepID=A0A365YR57_9PROT|nr:UdgX family uracil-DNA binding protein [Novacetimonas cocois]RBM05246.1 uracil-DNA glycosylase [Novacetimonas cocois]
MPTVLLAHCLDFATWRNATRTLILHGIRPEDIVWDIQDPAAPVGTPGLATPLADSPAPHATFGVSRAVMQLAGDVLQTQAPDRFGLAYSLIAHHVAGRNGQHDSAPAPDIARAEALAEGVRDDTRALRALAAQLRHDGGTGTWEGTCDAPASCVPECNARFITLQLSFQPWRLEMGDRTMRWDGDALHLEGALRDASPDSFPPPALTLVEGMDIERITSLPAVAETARSCLICPMAHHATQTVFGEGSATASLMFVGEQPGDQEDLIGRPFVGPAGQLFDRALQEVGIARDDVYVTNTVKHFKFFRRNGRRIHQKAGVEEIRACAPWLQAERRLVRPRLLVMLGATAASAILQRPVVIGRERSHPIPLDDVTQGLVTVHPSFLLRQPTAEAREREYARFVEDLRLARSLISS